MSFGYLALDDVLSIHRAQIERFGGAHGVRDLGLIEAALMRPQTGYYPSLTEQAAALWESLALIMASSTATSGSPLPARRSFFA